MKRILLIQRRALGDALFTALMAEVIKKELTKRGLEVEVHLLTLPFSVDFFKTYKYLDNVFPYRGVLKTLQMLRKHSYDAILDYEATFRTYPVVALSKAPIRLAFLRKRKDLWLKRIGVYTSMVPFVSRGFTYWDRLELLKPLGVDINPYLKTKPVWETATSPDLPEHLAKNLKRNEYVIFCPKGKLQGKTIAPEKAAQLATGLVKRLNKPVVVAIEPGERKYISAFEEELSKYRTGEVTVVSLPLREFSSLIFNSSGVVTVESFPYHLAMLMGKPSLVIVQAYDLWYRETFGLVKVYKVPLECSPCFDKRKCFRGDFACSREINTDEVLDLAVNFLNG